MLFCGSLTVAWMSVLHFIFYHVYYFSTKTDTFKTWELLKLICNETFCFGAKYTFKKEKKYICCGKVGIMLHITLFKLVTQFNLWS